jgi:hypothetical protein
MEEIPKRKYCPYSIMCDDFGSKSFCFGTTQPMDCNKLTHTVRDENGNMVYRITGTK